MCARTVGCLHLWTFSIVLLTAGPVVAQDYVSESRTIAATSQPTTQRFSFILDKDSPYPHLDFTVQMSRGRAELRILDPAGRELERLGAQVCTIRQPISRATSPGAYTAQVTTTDAIGQWRLRVYGGPAPSTASIKTPGSSPAPGLVGAGCMMLVAFASVWFWRRSSGVAWRWFWVGAAVWTVAVAVKLAIAFATNGPVLLASKPLLPRWAYLTVGTIYGGALTGVTEVLLTAVAALIWRRMAADAARGVAIGVGAGAFEAALLATGAGVVAVLISMGVKLGEDVSASAMTWATAFPPAIERATAIACHTASRALVLLAIARGRWSLFFYGFALLSGLDALVMFLYLTGRVGTMSPWAMEALLVPFGLLSIPITIWCIRQWPQRPLERGKHQDESLAGRVVGAM